MSDPTAPVLIAAFASAIALFAAACLVRWSARKGAAVPEMDPLSADGTAALPPPLPAGVPVWPFRWYDFLLAAVIAGIFASLSLMTALADSSKIEYSPQALLSSILFQGMIGLFAFGFMVWRINPLEWLGIRWRKWPWVFLIAPGSVVCMWLVFGGLQQAGYMKWIESLGVESMQDSVKLLQTSNDPAVLVLMAVAAVIVAPVCEEIIFRGYLFSFAKRYSGTWVAAICSGLIFSAAHGSLVALLPLFIFGILLALLYERTGSIWAPMSVHFCFNAATVAIQFLLRQYPDLIQQAQ